jgi:tRNA threonylcarbamoyladenosine biosynthesis protein TsaE
MATLISKSPEETAALGEQWGREARPGWVIGLSGDLGAGKTQLVRGLARGLGSSQRVHSPTFALLNEYGGGRLRLFHLDLYRLENRAQIVAAGLEEYLVRPDGVAVVEWIEKWLTHEGRSSAVEIGTTLPITRLVRFEVLSENERRITYEDSGA